MSTDSRSGAQSRANSEPRRRRTKQTTATFWRRVAAVVGVLAVLSGVGAGIALTQGPRLTNVTFDEQAAIESSGTRLTLTTNQALDGITADDVTVTPATDFTVDAQGRNIGVRFTAPLNDATTYTVKINGVNAVGGGPEVTIETSITTAPASIFLLQRDGTGELDMIVTMPIDGMSRQTIFTHDHIEEMRVAPDALVILVEEDDRSAIIITDRDGTNPRYATLPGDGYISSLQVAHRGGAFGYLFTDRELTETTGRASILYTASIHDPAAEPVELSLASTDPSVADWMFVPDSPGLLTVTFAGDLLLAADGSSARLGTAYAIDGISRGTYEAIIDRSGVPVGINLQTGVETPIELPALSGTPGRVEPAADDGQLWAVTQRDEGGLPTGHAIELVASDGSMRTVVLNEKTDPILQFCVSPSAQYVAVIVAPDYANNPYDTYTRPMPKTVTRIVDVDNGSVISELNGFDISWCSRSQF